jgi:putative flippase GtrA
MPHMIRLSRETTRFATYVLGGVLSAATDIGLMQAAILAGVEVYAATSFGFVAGLLVNYTYHAKVTFDSAMDAATFFRYLCVTGLSYGLTLACVAASLSLVGNGLSGKILSLPVIAIIGFWLSKRWIFR